MFSKSILLCVFLLLLAPLAGAQPQSPAKNSYEALLERVKKSDTSVDFKELRLAYAETSTYSPYGGDAESRRMMFDALKAREYDKALQNAETVLAKNYLDIMGHFGCFVSHRELAHADKATYHKFVFEGLLNSIKNSGDGKSEETAFVVISVDEEYALLNWLGLRPTGQALIKKDLHNYDKMTMTDPKTNDTITYFFNIDKPFNWLGNSLKK
jgi:hypothetical protein